jgi:drug/metabolite transporter (DMT)-like permease
VREAATVLVPMQEVGHPPVAPPEWRVWLALWTVYIVWGSTYLGIRVVVDTAPPLISAGARFASAGLLVYAFLFLKHGREGVRLSLRQAAGASAVGVCLVLGGNGMVSIAEQTVPSSFAALIYASIPLWIVLFRAFARERPSNATLVGVAVGYLGLAILLLPGGRPGDVSVGWALVLCAGAFSWAIGSFYSRQLPLPDDAALAMATTTIGGGALALIVGFLVVSSGIEHHQHDGSNRVPGAKRPSEAPGRDDRNGWPLDSRGGNSRGSSSRNA